MATAAVASYGSDDAGRPWHRFVEEIGRFLQYAYFARVPIIVALIVMFLPYADWKSLGAASMTRGIVAVQSPAAEQRFVPDGDEVASLVLGEVGP